jgi:hypothetical protein
MITTKQKKSLEYFKNRIVTVFVGAINRNFTEKDSINYFVGRLTEIDDNGIWYQHAGNGCMNFVFYEQVVAISEEQLKPKISNVEQPS